MNAVVIRHGETEWNVAGRLQGGLDSELSAAGLAQMRRVARRCQHLNATRLFCSPAQRARQSAELIVSANPSLVIEIRADLSEYNFGDLEGKTRSEVERLYPGFMQRWLADPTSQCVPRAEPVPEFFERVRCFLGELGALGDDGPVLVMTHGGVIRVLIGLILELEGKIINRLNPSNGGMSTVEFKGSVPLLTSFNETAHFTIRRDLHGSKPSTGQSALARGCRGC